MIRSPPLAFALAQPAHVPLRKTLPGAARAVRAAFLAIAAAALVGVAHADVDVSDSKAQDKLDDIKSRIGSGDLNRTTSDVLKEIQTSVANLGFFATLTPGNQLQKISDTSGYVQQACPSQGGALGGTAGAGGASQNVTSLATISAGNSSSVKQQICQQLIQLRVQAYNDSIEMTNRFQQYSEQLTRIDNNRGSAKTQGDLWANTNESLRTIGKLQAEMGFWRTRLAAYEAAIKFHEGQQNALTHAAIKGGGSGGLPTAGQLIQTGALAAALAVH